MPPLMVTTLSTSSTGLWSYSTASKPPPLSTTSASSSSAAAGASLCELWPTGIGSSKARFRPCRWRMGGLMVANMNLQAAQKEGDETEIAGAGVVGVAADADDDDAERESFRGGGGGSGNFITPSSSGPRTGGEDRRFCRINETAKQQNEFQDDRGSPWSFTARRGGENRRRDTAMEREGDGIESGERGSPLQRWLNKTSNDVWKAQKNRVYGDQEGKGPGAGGQGLKRTVSNEHLGIDSSESEVRALSWPERSNAMVQVQTADDMGAALLRVGRKLEITDLNAVLRRFGRLGKWKESYMLFDWMKKQGKLSAPTYTSFFSVLRKAGQVEKALEAFGELTDKDILSNLYVWNSLLSTLIWNGKVDKAFHFFRQLTEEGLEPDRITYSTMISGCSKALGGFYKAQELVKEMQKKGFKLDYVMYGALINVCATNHMVEEARATFDEMKAHGFAPNLFHFSALLNAYALKGKHEEAEHVIMEIKNSGLKPNKVVYNSLINAYSRAKLPQKAKEKFHEMSDYGLQPDMISYCSLMDAYGRVGQAEEAHVVFEQMTAAGLRPGSNSYSILISAYGRSGKMNLINKLSQEIDTMVGGDLDVHLYNALLKVYCQAGAMDGVMDILRKMDTKACSPNRITYHVLMAYFCKEDLHDLTIRTLHDMEARGYPANETSYTILIQGFLRQGKMEEAFELFRHMQQRGILPTRIIYQDLMSNFISLKMLNEAQEVFEHMKASRHVVSRTLLDTYLQLLVEEGKLEFVKAVLQMMNSIDYNPRQELWDLLLLKADAQMEYDMLKKLLEEPGCRPTPNTRDVLFNRVRDLGRSDLLQRLTATRQ